MAQEFFYVVYARHLCGYCEQKESKKDCLDFIQAVREGGTAYPISAFSVDMEEGVANTFWSCEKLRSPNTLQDIIRAREVLKAAPTETLLHAVERNLRILPPAAGRGCGCDLYSKCQDCKAREYQEWKKATYPGEFS